MPNLPEGYSIVSDREFEVLALSPTFTVRNECLHRTDGEHDYFVLKQSFYDGIQRLKAEVMVEGEHAEAEATFAELLQQPIGTPEPPIKPVTPPAPVVDPLAGDKAVGKLYGIGAPPPERPTNPNRPRESKSGFVQW
jgi:hypothetical protein